MSEAAAIETRPMLIGGDWVESENGESIEVENPGRRTIIGRECSLEGMLDSFTARKSVTVNLGIPDAPAS